MLFPNEVVEPSGNKKAILKVAKIENWGVKWEGADTMAFSR